MSLQVSVNTRNGMLDAWEVETGTDAVLAMYTGSAPANCAAADAGTELARMTLPTDYMAAAASGAKAKSGTWQDTSANAAGTCGYFRIYKSNGTTCTLQGTLTATGGGGDMTIDNAVVAVGQQITVTAFTLNMPNS